MTVHSGTELVMGHFFKTQPNPTQNFWTQPNPTGGTEIAGVENAIRAKLQGWKMQQWKMRE